MENLEFSYNWNNKLECKCFTSIRIHNDRKYKPGSTYHVYLKRKVDDIVDYGHVVLIEKKVIKLKDINEFIARIDTGYSKEECIKIIQRMYKNATPDTAFDFLLFQKNKA